MLGHIAEHASAAEAVWPRLRVQASGVAAGGDRVAAAAEGGYGCVVGGVVWVCEGEWKGNVVCVLGVDVRADVGAARHFDCAARDDRLQADA